MKNRIGREEKAYIIVEATIVFPIMILIFMGMIMLSTILPYKAALQHATQRAANAIAIELSDKWCRIDKEGIEISACDIVEEKPSEIPNALEEIIYSFFPLDTDQYKEYVTASVGKRMDWINMNMREGGFDKSSLDVKIEYKDNKVLVKASRKINFPLNIKKVGMKNNIEIEGAAIANLNDVDGFIRFQDAMASNPNFANCVVDAKTPFDVGANMIKAIKEKLDINKMFEDIGQECTTFRNIVK